MSRLVAAKARLVEHIEQIAKELAPGGVVAGGVYTPRNPTRADRNPGSFVIWLRGPAAGAWRDHATGEQGDAVDLVAYCLGFTGGQGYDRKKALAWIEDRFGLRSMSERDREEIAARSRAVKAKAEKEQATKDARDRSSGAKMFHDARPIEDGSPVLAYMRARGLHPERLPPIAGTFRWNPALEWWMGRDKAKGIAGPRFPALVTAMRDAGGKVAAVHCTFLAPDGMGKAPVPKAKLMWPRTAGAVIRVAHGHSGLDPEAAAAAGVRGPVVLMEGIEDGWTIAEADPRVRVWAAGSLPGLLSVYDHDCVSGWAVCRDRDWGKPQAAELFARAIARLEATGKPVTVLEPTSGKDVNDMVTG